MVLVIIQQTTRTKNPPVDLRPLTWLPPQRYGDWVQFDDLCTTTRSVACIASSIHVIDKPKTYAEALRSLKADKWQASMQFEYDSLMQNNAWRLAPLPAWRKATKCKWVYKVKSKPNGEIERFKARLVTKGYSQVEEIDYSETHAPVIKFDALRIIYAMITKEKMKMEEFDVCFP